MKLYDAGIGILILYCLGIAFYIFSQEGCSFSAKELDIKPTQEFSEVYANEKK